MDAQVKRTPPLVEYMISANEFADFNADAEHGQRIVYFRGSLSAACELRPEKLEIRALRDLVWRLYERGRFCLIQRPAKGHYRSGIRNFEYIAVRTAA